MKLKGKGLNPQVLIESGCYFLFGVLLFRLTITGTYLNYVTPRMKPYLYGLSALMILWAGVNGKNLFRPQYKKRVKRCLVLVVPILLFAVPPAPPAAGAMVKGLSSSSITSSSGGYQIPEESREDYEYYGQENLEKPEQVEEGNDLEVPEQKTRTVIQTTPPSFEIPGLNEETKTIDVSDEDFGVWVNELGMNPQKYEGYTITMKGLVLTDLEDRKDNEFALVRLSMWCCAADMAPMGLMTEVPGDMSFKENDWITLTGNVKVKEGYAVIDALDMKEAEKPSEEYVYPY